MPKPSLAAAILSLFTTREKAAEIEGDLIEQAHDLGRLWFLYHVTLTALALFRAALSNNFILVSLLSYATYELCAKTFFWGIRPLRRYVEFELAFSRSTTISLTYAVVVLFGFMVGNTLVRLLPMHGGQVAIGAIALVFLRLALLQEGYTVLQAGLCVAVPMIVGCVWASWTRPASPARPLQNNP